MWNPKYDTNELVYETENRLTDIENRLTMSRVGGSIEGWIRSMGLANANYYI